MLKKTVPLFLVVFGLLVVVVVIFSRIRPADLLIAYLGKPSAEELYPRPAMLPTVVNETVEELLARYEKLIEEKGPRIASTLQNGLTDAEIGALESQHHFKLTADLRALYHWRNGTPREALLNAFPGHEFTPLEDALKGRAAWQHELTAASPDDQRLHAVFTKHRESWLGLIVDGSGDGYFYDPDRLESEGSFFFSFAEDGHYIFFPAFRNYLAMVIEGCESGTFDFGDRGVETRDFEKSSMLQSKYGAIVLP
jgi:cell wall assembly regulator SMI1